MREVSIRRHGFWAPLLALAVSILPACGALVSGPPTEYYDPNAGRPDASVPDAWGADPTWEPTALSGLVLWLDGANGVSSGSSGIVWQDRSAKNNDAVSVGKMTIDDDAISGRTAAHFDGLGYLRIADAPSLQFGIGDYFVAIVARHTTAVDSGDGYGMLFTKQEASRPFIGPCITANAVGADSSKLPTTSRLLTQVDARQGLVTQAADFNTGKPFLLTARRFTRGDETTLALRANGGGVEVSGPELAEDCSAVGRSLFIGGTPEGQRVLGDIAEVIAVTGPLTEHEIFSAESYLKTKYAL